ncbi:hypothetical protein FJZ33_01340 [Candidatus Poribacteria bacterium]|nr:hypothetical protein [Candidatus Poribacteria bacterium]
MPISPISALYYANKLNAMAMPERIPASDHPIQLLLDTMDKVDRAVLARQELALERARTQSALAREALQEKLLRSQVENAPEDRQRAISQEDQLFLEKLLSSQTKRKRDELDIFEFPEETKRKHAESEERIRSSRAHTDIQERAQRGQEKYYDILGASLLNKSTSSERLANILQDVEETLVDPSLADPQKGEALLRIARDAAKIGGEKGRALVLPYLAAFAEDTKAEGIKKRIGAFIDPKSVARHPADKKSKKYDWLK